MDKYGSNLSGQKQNKIFFINTLVSWIFGVIVFLIGIINIFWGNDKYFGIFILMLSFIYLPPTNIYLKQKTKFKLSKKLKFF